jgi:beta-galactosidase/beta-glucuronidase
MTMPCRWSEGGLPDFAGRVRFRRRFGYPGRIDANERVWLTFAGAASVADVSLNGRFLGRHEGADEPFEFEVTSLLRDRNELIVEVESPTGDGGLWGEVALEIRCV